jgi:hypothetical protein
MKAAHAPVACVIRRGPSAWVHVLLWHYDTGEIEPGAWTRIKLYPERCAISPDGRTLAVFALGGDWGAYFAVSRAPWLHALAAWQTVGTWTSGSHLGQDRSLVLAGCADESPFVGAYPGPVACVPIETHWVLGRLFRERLTGWAIRAIRRGGVEGSHTPLWLSDVPAPLGSAPDAVVLGKPDPTNPERELVLVALDERTREFYLRVGDQMHPLEEVATADWTPEGSILAGTRSGVLAVFDDHRRVSWRHDLNGLRPDPQPAPDWARSW